MPVLLIIPRVDSKLASVWRNIIDKLSKTVSFPKSDIKKRPRQGYTPQNLRVGMHQNHNFQWKPITNLKNPEIRVRSTIEIGPYFWVWKVLWNFQDLILVPPWFYYHPDFTTTLILLPPWFYYPILKFKGGKPSGGRRIKKSLTVRIYRLQISWRCHICTFLSGGLLIEP